jgi:hypothetical protein
MSNNSNAPRANLFPHEARQRRSLAFIRVGVMAAAALVQSTKGEAAAIAPARTGN